MAVNDCTISVPRSSSWNGKRIAFARKRGRGICQLLPDGPTSRKSIKQGRGRQRPDSATPVRAHHEELGDVVWIFGEDQGKPASALSTPEQKCLLV
jgi:hypothetical protein